MRCRAREWVTRSSREPKQVSFHVSQRLAVLVNFYLSEERVCSSRLDWVWRRFSMIGNEEKESREGWRGGVEWSGDCRRVTQCREMSWHSPRSAATFEFESLKKSFAFSVSRSPFRATPGRPPGWLRMRMRGEGADGEYCEQQRGSLNGQREQRFIRDALLLDLRANENC